MTIFVTGGAGYIGRNLIRVLLERGHTVRALAYSLTDGEVIDSLGGTVIVGNYLNKKPILRGMADCDAIIHCAGTTRTWDDPLTYHKLNIAETDRIVSFCRGSRVPRLIIPSTTDVIADGKPKIYVDESLPYPKRPIGLYPLTKRWAEEKVLSANNDSLTTIVVRGQYIWGNDDTVWLPRLIEGATRGGWMWLNRGHHLVSTCHVANLIEGMIRAVEHGDGGKVYQVTDGDPVELRNFITNLLQTQGIPAPERQIQGWAGMALANIGETVVRRANLNRHPPFTRIEVAMMRHEFTLNDNKARDELGYTQVITREDGMADLARRKRQPQRTE